MNENVYVRSDARPLNEIFSLKYSVGFYQREYVWQRKQLEDLIMDLSSEFLNDNWKPEHDTGAAASYRPYFMGEIVLAEKNGGKLYDIIDGQQRITTITLILIYLCHRFGHVDKFQKEDVVRLIYADDFGTYKYNLDVDERRECMEALRADGKYTVKPSDKPSVRTIVERYADIDECWNDKIDDSNIRHFTYWLMHKVMFSMVVTNSDEFAYVIFETMNDRGQSLTQVEMLRSYLLANIDASRRDEAMNKFDGVVKTLKAIPLGSISKAEFEFFKVYFRGHLAETLSQAKDSQSDFLRIGKEFHRWVRDCAGKLGLDSSEDFSRFIDRIDYYASVYARIHDLIAQRNSKEYLYLIVNSDYGFTLQPSLILASVDYLDDDKVVSKKIKIVSKYISKVLSWKVWNQKTIAQSSLEAPIYELCRKIRGKDVPALEQLLRQEADACEELQPAPVFNHQYTRKFKVLLALITEIVARESGQGGYVLEARSDIEVEHIWSDHFERHKDEFDTELEFDTARNTIGDLLVLPKSFNASYGADPYEKKVVHYYRQNILAQSLNERSYENNPGFVAFRSRSGLEFKSYEKFKKSAIAERTELYKAILMWNWK